MLERDEGGESPCLAPLFEEELFGPSDDHEVVDRVIGQVDGAGGRAVQDQ